MLGFLGAAWDFVKGVGSLLGQGLKWLAGRLVNLADFFFTLLGIMVPKRIKVQAVILLREDRSPVAERAEVQAMVDLARDVFKEQMKVRLVSPGPSDVIIHPEPAPSNVLNFECSRWLSTFTSAGAWFRANSKNTILGRFAGYGAPVTVFVVDEVTGDAVGTGGCSAGWRWDYVVIEEVRDYESEETKLRIAHEVGHACDLGHKSRTLMNRSQVGRTKRLSRWQKAVFRSSRHVTFF